MNGTASWVWSVSNGGPVFWSPEMWRIHGHAAAYRPPTADEYRSFHRIEDWLSWVAAVHQSTCDKTDFDLDTRVVLPSGAIQDVCIHGHPILDVAGEVTEIIGWTSEIATQTANARPPTRAAANALPGLIDMIPALAWSSGPDGSADFFNRAWLDYTGLTREQAKGDGWTSAVHPDDVSTMVAYWASVLASGEPGELEARLRRSDGKYRWFLFRATSLRDDSGHILSWYGTNTDIEDLKRAQEALRKSEEQLRQLVETIPAFVWRGTPEGELEYLNYRFIRYLGHRAEDLSNGRWLDLVHPSDRESTVTKWLQSADTGSPYEDSYRLKRADGEYRWVHSTGEPFRDKDGRIAHWYGVLTDIHDRKEAELAVEESEHRLRLIIDTIPALVWRAAPDGEPDYLNERVVAYTGKGLEDFVGLRWADLIHPEELEITIQAWTNAVTNGVPYDVQHRLRCWDGSYRWFHVSGAPLRDENGQIVHWFGLDIDIDDRKKIAEELREANGRLSRASQVATVAELSASIAHEINQPLASVVANGHACQAWLSKDPPNLERARITAERIIRDGNSAADVVQRIRALFRYASQEKTPCQMNQLVDEVLSILRDDIRNKDIVLEQALPPGLPTVAADGVQMQQVLINLVHNAIDAMDKVVGRPKVLAISSRQDGSDILVEVCDSGCGITDQTLIFDPFFTTKSNGMGIGLSVCRSIVEDHGGRLWATPNAAAGTTFSFTVPVSSEAIYDHER